MDLEATIHQLKTRKHKLDLAIAELEQLQATGGDRSFLAPNRPGRRSMAPEERQRVSERMKQYWAKRREQES